MSLRVILHLDPLIYTLAIDLQNMDSTAESAEVVEDFKDALQDLQSNSKPTIDVLTVIAKENTAHAEAISNVLEEHIKTVSMN